MTYGGDAEEFLISLVPLLLTAGTLSATWWYVVIHQQAGAASGPVEGLQQLGSAVATPEADARRKRTGPQFYLWFAIIAGRAGGCGRRAPIGA